MLLVWTSTLAFTPLVMSPVVTFAVFTWISHSTGERLDTSKLFTSLSLTQPLINLFQAIPSLLAAAACFRRIEEFLLTLSQADLRVIMPEKDIPKTNGTEVSPGDTWPRDTEDSSAIVIRDGYFGWSKDRYTLQDINISIPRAQLTAIVGPIASGKSTLCSAILGETVVSRGQVCLNIPFPSIAYSLPRQRVSARQYTWIFKP